MNIDNYIQALENVELDETQHMKKGKAKGWLGEYHWVSLPSKHMEQEDKPHEWCIEHFGKSGARWYENKGKFFFKDEKDMTMFILKWS